MSDVAYLAEYRQAKAKPVPTGQREPISYMEQADADLIQWCAVLHEITRSMREEFKDAQDDDFARVLGLWHENFDAIILTRSRHPASLKAKAGVVPIMLAMVGPSQAADLAQSLASDILGED